MTRNEKIIVSASAVLSAFLLACIVAMIVWALTYEPSIEYDIVPVAPSLPA